MITQTRYFKAEHDATQLIMTPDIKAIHEDFSDFLEAETDFDETDLESQLLEDLMCNCGWDYIRPDEVAALTSAPLISPDATRNEDGDLTSADTIYGYMNYQVDSWVQELCAGNMVVWQTG